MIGRNGMESIMPYHHQLVSETIMKCFASPNTVFQVKMDKPDKNNGVKNTLWDFVCLTDENGKPLEIQCCGIDVSESTRAEKKLEASDMRLKQAQAMAHLGSWDVDFATNVTLWSEENCRIFGLPSDDTRQSLKSYLSFVHPDDLEYVSKIIGDSMATFRNIAFYHRIIRKDGAVRYIHSENQFEFDDSGKPTRLSGITHDITELRGMEAGLRKSEANLRTIFENTDVGFLFLSQTYAVLAYNKTSIEWAASVFGIQIDGHANFRELLLPQSRAGFDAFAGGILAGRSITYETSYPKPDGSLMWFTVSGKPVMDDTHVTGICIAITDITARRESEDKMSKMNNLNAFRGQINKNIVHVKDKIDLFKNACRIAREFGEFKIAWIGLFDEPLKTISLVDQTGLTESQVQHFANLQYKPDGPQKYLLDHGGYYVSNNIETDPGLQSWKALGEEFSIRSCVLLAIKKADKVIGTLNLYSTEVGFFDDEKIKLLGEVARDISFALNMFEKADRQIEAEELVKKNEKRFRSLIEKSSDMITLATADGEMIYGSPSVSDILGYTAEEFLNKPGFDFIHPDDIAVFLAKRKEILKTPGASFHLQQRLRHKNGEWLWCENTDTNMLHDPDVNAIVSNFRDITERHKSAELLLKNKNELADYKFALDESAIVTVTDQKGIIKHVNSNFCRISKYAESELIDQNHRIISSGYHSKEFIRNLWETIASGKLWKGELKNKAKDGSLYWVDTTIVPFLDQSGKPYQYVSIRSEITARKNAEEELLLLNNELEERVRVRTAELSETNKALEAFSYSVSHDLLSPVRIIKGFTRIILQDHGEGMVPDLKELFHFVEDSSNRMGNLINDLLVLAKYGKEKLQIVPVNMGEMINSIWANMAQTTPNKVKLELSKLPVVKADLSLIEQVLINLLSNAIKYSSKKEDPVLKIWSEKTKENVTFFFKDNGAGFDMKNYHRLFGPFQRLHSVSEFEGTGVGLMLVKRIIEQHGGVVGAEGIVGEEATFHFTLPKAIDGN